MILNKIKSVHFIGIGGIGMSSLAFYLRTNGVKVTGSDINDSKITRKLKRNGCMVNLEHKADNIQNQDLIIYSSAIQKNNPEIIEAKKRKIKILKRGEALGLFTKDKKNLTITGCHGKSTTSSIAHYLINNSGISLSAFLGAEDKILKSNFFKSDSEYCLIEGDESDNSFNQINSYMSIVTNIDNDHLDFYGSEKNLTLAFKEFILNTKKRCIANNDSKKLNKLLNKIQSKKVLKFGKNNLKDVDYSFQIIDKKYSSIELFKRGKSIGVIKSTLFGEYNSYNLAAAVILALEMGVKIKDIIKISKRTKAPIRRFETIAKKKNLWIVDDYAHHPTAIRAVRENLEKNFLNNNVILIFQPHRFSRTKILLKDFVNELSLWKDLYLVDVYSAFEDESISVQTLFKKIKKVNRNALYFQSKDRLIKKVLSKLKDNKYTILTMGAGDIRSVANELKEKI